MKNKIIGKTFEILKIINDSSEPVNINVISKMTNINSATVSRILSDLVELNLVEKSSYQKVIPGFGIIHMGQIASENYPLVQLVNPIMYNQAKKFNLNCALAKIVDNEVIYLYRSPEKRQIGTIGMPYHTNILNSFIAMLIITTKYGLEEATQIYTKQFEQKKSSIISYEEILLVLKYINLYGYLYHKNEISWRLCFPLNFNDEIYSISFYEPEFNFSQEPALLIPSLSKCVSEIQSMLS